MDMVGATTSDKKLILSAETSLKSLVSGISLGNTIFSLHPTSTGKFRPKMMFPIDIPPTFIF